MILLAKCFAKRAALAKGAPVGGRTAAAVLFEKIREIVQAGGSR
jgi:hypothetical protein